MVIIHEKWQLSNQQNCTYFMFYLQVLPFALLFSHVIASCLVEGRMKMSV
jgi:hypothetical protein